MNMTPKPLRLALMTLLILSAAVGAVPAAVGATPAAAPPPLPEYGFRGLKRVELVFVNIGPSGMAGGIVDQKGSAAAEVPADDVASRDLAKDIDCQAIGKTLSNAGLEVVDHCKPDDFACGQLYLAVANHSSDRIADRLYLTSATLSQRVKLARDKKVELATPSTWSAYRVVDVEADRSATRATCIELRSLATWFGSSWRIANK